MPNRVTGLNSGLDTETLVTSLVSSYQKKVDTLQGNQKRHSWKQDAWKTLNKSTVSFYNGKLNTMAMQSSFNKKVTTSTNASAVTIVTGSNAMNATQTMQVKSTAKSSFKTGTTVKHKDGNEVKLSGDTKLSELGITGSQQLTVKIGKTVNNGDAENPSYALSDQATTVTLDISADDTLASIASKLKGVKGADGFGLNANFDAANERFYLAGSKTGDGGSFQIEGSAELMSVLGLDSELAKGDDAQLTLNGVDYFSNSGTFEINGLTITANEVTDKEFTITTKTDNSGVYDMIKDFLKEYNNLIKQMDTGYYADPARKYNMLTDDEKEAMSDKEVEEWEKHIKEGLLAKDSTLYDVIQGLKGVMQSGITVNGVELHLSDFGINTGSYLTTDQNERGMYHIDGDPDDSTTSANADKLKSMIASDPDTVATFFSKMAQNLRSKLFDMMKSTDYSSSFTIYEDKLMASQYSDYNSKITDATERLNRKQDNYYAKFTRMEKAMAKINSVQSNLSGYFGGG